MNHLLQVARRTGKSAVGFKIQLVIHRMNAHLSNFNGAELVAVMTRHKKKATTKGAPYQSATKEVVWGDILPFSCTLYMAKTGLFQGKLFQVHIFDTRNDQNVATFEFDLAELVQSDKDAGKETITVATSKCQDPRASLSITVISSRVLHFVGGGRKGSGGYGDHDGSEVSFDGSRSELSVSTMDSRTSATSSHHQQPHYGKVPTGTTHRSPDNAKANGLRGAFPAVNEDEVDEQEEAENPGESLRQHSKHQELELEVELKLMIASLQSENKQLLERVGDLTAQTHELKAEIEAKDEALAKAAAAQPPPAPTNEVGDNSESDDQEVRMSEVTFQNERLVKQLGQLDGVVSQLMTERTSLLDKLEHAEHASTRAREDLDDAQETISELREQVQELSEQLTAAQQYPSNLNHGELAASLAATADAVAKNKELHDRLVELGQQNDELETRVKELEEMLARAEANGEAKETELLRQIEALKHEAETVREDLAELRASKQQAEDELLERTAELKEALETQRRLTVGHDEELAQLAMGNEELQVRVDQRVEEAQVLSTEWRQKVDLLVQENDYFQRELIDSKMKLAELTQQNDELAAQNKKMEKAVVEMKIHAAERDLKDAKKK